MRYLTPALLALALVLAACASLPIRIVPGFPVCEERARSWVDSNIPPDAAPTTRLWAERAYEIGCARAMGDR